MNEKGANSVMSSKVKLGADASASAGPVGRTSSAETDVAMKAEILSYSRAKGIFGGVSLEGSTLRSDGGADKNLYGKELDAKQIVRENKGHSSGRWQASRRASATDFAETRFMNSYDPPRYLDTIHNVETGTTVH